MSKYSTHYDSYLRAHFQGVGAATAGSGVGVNEPQTLGGIPLPSGLPTDNQTLLYSAANNSWIYGSASVTFANPTAVASEIAINGVSTTAMRSDAAPAIQKATTSQFGLVKPDGTTITISTGVISVPTGSSSTLGVLKVDNTTITASAGVISIPSNVSLPGSPTTTTQSSSDNSTRIATTAFVQAVTIGGFVPTGAAFHPGYVSGQKYFSAQALAGSGSSSVTSLAATLNAVPFFVPVSTTFGTIGIHVVAAVAGSSLQLGVYANTNGLPGTLIKDCGNVATTSNNSDATIGGISLSLAPGWYWLAMGTDATHAPSFSADATNQAWLLGNSSGSLVSAQCNVKNTWTPGALPSSFPLTGYTYGAANWLIFLSL